MPTPLGHTLIGTACYLALVQRIKWYQGLVFFIFVIAAANLPDLDLFFGFWAGDVKKYHALHTHTLGFVLLTGLVIWLAAKFWKLEHPGYLALTGMALVFLHNLTDTFNHDTRPPAGVMLFWPLTSRYFNILPVFPSFNYLGLRFFTLKNFWALIVETVIGGLLILLVLALRNFISPPATAPAKGPATGHCPDQKSA